MDCPPLTNGSLICPRVFSEIPLIPDTSTIWRWSIIISSCFPAGFTQLSISCKSVSDPTNPEAAPGSIRSPYLFSPLIAKYWSSTMLLWKVGKLKECCFNDLDVSSSGLTSTAAVIELVVGAKGQHMDMKSSSSEDM